MRLIPLHRVDPSVRTDVPTLRGIAMLANAKYYPKGKYYGGTLDVFAQTFYDQMSRTLHKDRNCIDDKCYWWSHMIDALVINNSGAVGLQPKADQHYDSLKQQFHHTIMGIEELKVMLQGVFTTAPENYTPNHYFRTPIPAARWGFVLELQHTLLQ